MFQRLIFVNDYLIYIILVLHYRIFILDEK